MIQVLGALDFTPLSHDILRRGASRRHSTQAEGRSSDLHLLRFTWLSKQSYNKYQPLSSSIKTGIQAIYMKMLPENNRQWM